MICHFGVFAIGDDLLLNSAYGADQLLSDWRGEFTPCRYCELPWLMYFVGWEWEGYVGGFFLGPVGVWFFTNYCKATFSETTRF